MNEFPEGIFGKLQTIWTSYAVKLVPSYLVFAARWTNHMGLLFYSLLNNSREC